MSVHADTIREVLAWAITPSHPELAKAIAALGALEAELVVLRDAFEVFSAFAVNVISEAERLDAALVIGADKVEAARALTEPLEDSPADRAEDYSRIEEEK
jgi:hypothetical protein